MANRRIKAMEREYKKAGKEILPQEVVGKYQTTDKWETTKNPISRSVVFESEKEYESRLKMLQSFDPKIPTPKQKKTMTQFKEIQKDKLKAVVEKTMGTDLPPELEQRIDKMSVVDLDNFWNRFSEKSSKLGLQYSSERAIDETMQEMFPEDYDQFVNEV